MLFIAKVAFGLSLLGIILWRFDMQAVLRAIAGYHALYLLAAACISMIGTLLSAVRWRLFAPQFAYMALLRLSFIGQFYAVLLPGQLAGEAVKAYRLAKGQSEKAKLVASVAIDRVVGTLALLLLGAIGLWLTPHAPSPLLGWSLGAIVLLLCLLLLVLRVPAVYRLAGLLARRLACVGPRSARVAGAIEQLLSVWRDYSKAPSTLFASFVLGLAFHCLAVAIYAVLASDLGIEVLLVDWLWITAIVALALILPVSVAGIGLREGALIGSLGFLGVSGERAIALSFGIFALMVLGALVGWIVEVTDRTQVKPVD